MSMLDQLLEMGFNRDIAENALRETNEVGIIEAMDWICDIQDNQKQKTDDLVMNNPGESEVVNLLIGDPVEKVEISVSNNETVEANECLSFVCNSCGKVLRDQATVLLHAAKTNHDDFSESKDSIKTLTEEEKQEALLNLQAKLKQARLAKEKADSVEAIEKEKKRRLDGKNMLMAEELRRAEEQWCTIQDRQRAKKQEAAARKRVLEQIRMDREDLKSKVSDAKCLLGMTVSSSGNVPTSSSEFCNVQVRLRDGTLLKERFKSDEILGTVQNWIESNEGPTEIMGPFSLITPFPRRVFCESDLASSLHSLGFCPSITLVVMPKCD